MPSTTSIGVSSTWNKILTINFPNVTGSLHVALDVISLPLANRTDNYFPTCVTNPWRWINYCPIKLWEAPLSTKANIGTTPADTYNISNGDSTIPDSSTDNNLPVLTWPDPSVAAYKVSGCISFLATKDTHGECALTNRTANTPQCWPVPCCIHGSYHACLGSHAKLALI